MTPQSSDAFRRSRNSQKPQKIGKPSKCSVSQKRKTGSSILHADQLGDAKDACQSQEDAQFQDPEFQGQALETYKEYAPSFERPWDFTRHRPVGGWKPPTTLVEVLAVADPYYATAGGSAEGKVYQAKFADYEAKHGPFYTEEYDGPGPLECFGSDRMIRAYFDNYA